MASPLPVQTVPQQARAQHCSPGLCRTSRTCPVRSEGRAQTGRGTTDPQGNPRGTDTPRDSPPEFSIENEGEHGSRRQTHRAQLCFD